MINNPFSKIDERFDRLEARFDELAANKQQQANPQLPIDIGQAALITKKSKYTIYGLVNQNRIPFHKRAGRLYFFENELINWIRSK
jgi:predicted DNA-binding transcriptional regulator AlpA